MISPFPAFSIQELKGPNAAAVCSTPPSDVGIGITASVIIGRPSLEDVLSLADCGRGRKYMYIWVVKRFGIFGGVIQRVNGIRASASEYVRCAKKYEKLEDLTGIHNATL